MDMAEHLDMHADWQEREADKADAREDRLRATLATAWDECLADFNIDTPIGGGYYTDLIEVLNLACSDADQTIQRMCMQALVHCAAAGQADAIEALEKVKEFFITTTLEFHHHELPRTV